jgi:hypothetical protein
MSTSAISQCKRTAEQITRGINKIKEERKIIKEEHKLIDEIHDLVKAKISEAAPLIKGGSIGKSRKYRNKIVFKKRRTRRRRRKF